MEDWKFKYGQRTLERLAVLLIIQGFPLLYRYLMVLAWFWIQQVFAKLSVGQDATWHPSSCECVVTHGTCITSLLSWGCCLPGHRFVPHLSTRCQQGETGTKRIYSSGAHVIQMPMKWLLQNFAQHNSCALMSYAEICIKLFSRNGISVKQFALCPAPLLHCEHLTSA